MKCFKNEPCSGKYVVFSDILAGKELLILAKVTLVSTRAKIAVEL